MQRLEVSCAVRPIHGSLSAKGLKLRISKCFAVSSGFHLYQHRTKWGSSRLCQQQVWAFPSYRQICITTKPPIHTVSKDKVLPVQVVKAKERAEVWLQSLLTQATGGASFSNWFTLRTRAPSRTERGQTCRRASLSKKIPCPARIQTSSWGVQPEVQSQY
jgi:hypothetical protein